MGNHNTAEYWEYDTRLGRRWNIDPVEQIGLSRYANNNNPILYKDVNGDCPSCVAAFLGALTEYAGIIGSKMLFENKTFSEANNDLTWKDGLDIGVAAAFGAASGSIDGGISKFTSWVRNPTNQKNLAKILEVGVSTLEGSLKQIYKEDFNLKSIVAGALTEVGLGTLLKTDVFKEASEQASRNATTATRRAEDLAARGTPNQRLINKAKNQAASQESKAVALKKLDNFGKASKGSVAKTAANKAQDATKPEKLNENSEGENTSTPDTNTPVIYNTGSGDKHVISPGTY